MATSIYQEFYKMLHRKVTWITPSLMVIFMLVMAIGMGRDSTNLLVMTCYNSGQWILIVLTIVGSTIFSSEYQNNAILTIIYKARSRQYVYFSKLITMIIYSIVLHLIAILLTVILSLTPLNAPVNWLGIYQYNQSLLTNMLLTTLVDFVTSLLLISIIFVLSSLINSNSAVITVSMGVIFFGSFISTEIIRGNSAISNIVKWNPLNMSNLTNQYFNYGSYHPVTLLSNEQLMLGAIVYTIVFLMMGYTVFWKKSF